MIVLALTQMLGVGTTALIAQAAGQKDQSRAELVFNQSLIMSLLLGLGLAVCGFALRDSYCRSLAADPTTATLAKSYLLWFIPALALQFPLVTMTSSLRATGVIKPAVGVPMFSVALNMMLAPFLVLGIGPFPRLGVGGAALATFISILIAEALMFIYFERKYHYLRFRKALLRPKAAVWRKMLGIGLPAGAEFMLLFVYVLVVYAIIRSFGPAAQAGFGVGVRIMQALFLPVVALSFAVSPIVGQNFGGRQAARVRQSVYSALGMACIFMVGLTIVAFFAARPLIQVFSRDGSVIGFGAEYLRIVSANFVAAGIVFTVSSVFQGIGNTWPPLLSSASRLVLFVLPAMLISRMPGFEMKQLWYLSVASQVFQAGVNLLLLRFELRRKLIFRDVAPAEVIEA
jgi:putative MATE family efflux protein